MEAGENKLTKKERRVLAKEEKLKTRKKEKLVKKLRHLFNFVVIGGLLIGGFYYLISSKPQASEKAKEKFVSYAEELGLNKDQFRVDLESTEVEDRINQDITQGKSQGINATPTFFLNGEKLQSPKSYDDFSALVNGVILDSDNRVDYVIEENDRVKGNKEASVVLIEYTDFQCSACGIYYPMVEQLGEEFAEELLIIIRHFPLVSTHRHALLAAKAAEAAANQGKFWEMYDLLFERQTDWSVLP